MFVFYISNHPEMFVGKNVLKICSKFTGEHSCFVFSWSTEPLIINILYGWFGFSQFGLCSFLFSPVTKLIIFNNLFHIYELTRVRHYSQKIYCSILPAFVLSQLLQNYVSNIKICIYLASLLTHCLCSNDNLAISLPV